LTLVLALAGAPAGSAGEGPARGEAPGFETGKLIPSVVTAHDPGQSYALYLPKKYDPRRKWPILYGFSPYGRGTGNVPVKLFQQAAEKYGWIVVGSNNSRNGPWPPIAKAVNAMMKDTAARFSIDPARRYATGFSGGARVAFHLACHTKPQFAGVIPIGAGMMGNQKRPGGDLAVYAVCGQRDVNHAELLILRRRLAGWKLRHVRLSNFDGGHTWPPAESCAPAVRYMELLRLCNLAQQRSAADDRLLLELLAAERESAEKLLKTPGRLLRGHARLSELAALVQGAPAAAGIRKRLAEVEAGEQFKAEQAAVAELRKVSAQARKATDANRRTVQLLAARAGFIEKHTKSEAAAREMVIMRAMASSLSRNVQQAMARQDYGSAEVFFRCLRLAAPREKEVAYGLACTLARNGKKEEAIKALAAAVSLGFSNLKRIRQDPHLELLRSDPTLQELLKLIDPQSAGGGAADEKTGEPKPEGDKAGDAGDAGE
jgi:hypothetical protein